MNREVEKGRALDENEEQQVVASLIKQRRDSIEQFRNGGREDLADKEAAEIATLEVYLPPPVDPGGDRTRRRRGHRGSGRHVGEGPGKVMKAVMPKLPGRAVDGRMINELVRRKLGALNRQTFPSVRSSNRH